MRLLSEINREEIPDSPSIVLEKKTLIIVTSTVLVTFFLNLLAGAVHGVATPSIMAEFGEIKYYALTITTFMLGGSLGRVISGKLGDMYGRRNIYLLSILLFALGNLLTGLAPTIGMLIFFKAILGLGAGFLFATCFTVIADLYSPQTRVRVLGILASMIGVSYIVGPLVGGYIVDTLSWRWLYGSTVPLLAIILFAVYKLLPNMKPAVQTKLDYLGILLICTTSVPFMLALTWGGSTYPWISPIIIILFLISIISLILFIIVERKAEDPLLPVNVITNRYFIIPTFLYALATYQSVIYLTYIPLYGQAVLDLSAVASGSLITPLMIVLIFATQLIGIVLSKTLRYKAAMLFLFVWMGLAMFLIAGFDKNTSIWYVYGVLSLIGISMGGFNVVMVSYMQNRLPHSVVGVSTGALYFFGNLTNVIALSVAGAIMNTTWKIDKYMTPNLQQELTPEGLALLSSTEGLTNRTSVEEVRESLSTTLQGVFDSTIIAMKDLLVQVFEYMYLLNVGLSILGLIIVFIFVKENRVKEVKVEEKLNTAQLAIPEKQHVDLSSEK